MTAATEGGTGMTNFDAIETNSAHIQHVCWAHMAALVISASADHATEQPQQACAVDFVQ